MLQITNQSEFATMAHVLADQTGMDTLYVVVRGTFDLTARPKVAARQAPPIASDLYWTEPGTSSLKYASEVHVGKQGTDVALVGHAYAPRGRATGEMLAALTVAERQKVVRSSTPPDTEFAAELVSVTFKSGIKTSHLKAEVKVPHWEAGKDAEIEDDWKDMAKKLGVPAEPYSKRAAVFVIKSAAGAYDVEVKVKVTKSKNVSGDAKLLGNLQGLAIEGSCPTGAGEHTVAASSPNRQTRSLPIGARSAGDSRWRQCR